MLIKRILWVGLGLLLLASNVTAAFSVFVSIPPQKYFVERIGGERVQVQVLVAPGQSPATYDLSPKQMLRLGQADLFFSIGVPYERRWLAHFEATPRLSVIPLQAGIALRNLPARHVHSASAQEHGIKDPHIWTNPRLVQHMATAIYQALIALDPQGAHYYQPRYNSFVADLASLDQEIRARMQTLRHRRFLVFHPSWGYFADAYGLSQWAVESEGKAPGAKALTTLVKEAQATGVKTIFVQPQFSRRIVDTLATAMGAKVKVVDPLAESYIENLRQVSQQFAEAMR